MAMKNTATKNAEVDVGVSNTAKDPKTWVTGGEPMTGAQKSYLSTLSEEAGVEMDENLTKAEASKKIDELKSVNPRTRDADARTRK